MSDVLALPRERPLRVLALGAHADDLEIGCGGTVARLLEERPDSRVTWVVLSGEPARAAEARASAAALLGPAAARIALLEGRDGFLPYEAGATKDALLQLREEPGPDLVLTHRREDLHQDHAFAAQLAWQVFRSARIVEFEVPKYEGDLGPANLYVPLARPLAAGKVDGLMTHFKSQQAHDWFTAETFWALLRLRGLECRAPSGYAEAFTCRKLVA
ncbi:MAG: PIG-L deacetylase family protein [Candidatus Limnocylindrales bacterium]